MAQVLYTSDKSQLSLVYCPKKILDMYLKVEIRSRFINKKNQKVIRFIKLLYIFSNQHI